ncbi:type IV secretion system protein VirB10 (plasmid) [Brevundimonas staleyi]|uniref:Type IV secretion system protein VirB10 n=1 Tax=Brevundimonas staleyi TaxID=74326 RepID=A0ABW0FNW4_9CAUL
MTHAEDDGLALRPAPAPEVQADRGVSPISGRLGGRTNKIIAVVALVVGAGVFLAATWKRDDVEASAPVTPPRQVVPFEPAQRDTPPTLAEAASDPNAPQLGATPADGQVPAIEPTSGGRGTATAAQTEAQRRAALLESAQRAPIMAYGSGQGRRSAAPAGVPGGLGDGVATLAAAAEPNDLDALRRSSPIGEARAGRLPDRRYLITAGTTIPCVLQTAMDTSTPGYVTCVVPTDVYSDNGAVILMEKGTRVMGEYRGGLRRGQNRMFVLWTRAVTPGGVAVALASPAADALGRAGFGGDVDTHFWERFGGALLLSLVDDGVYAATGNGDQGQSTLRLPSDAAGIALQNSINIPPTLRKAQGSEVSIFAAQDLNFASVYALRSR